MTTWCFGRRVATHHSENKKLLPIGAQSRGGAFDHTVCSIDTDRAVMVMFPLSSGSIGRVYFMEFAALFVDAATEETLI